MFALRNLNEGCCGLGACLGLRLLKEIRAQDTVDDISCITHNMESTILPVV